MLCLKSTKQFRRPLILLLSAVSGWAAEIPKQAPPPAQADIVDFARDIRPIFESRCYECHGEKKQKGGMRLDRKTIAFQGGDSGKPGVVAGKSAESALLQRVTSKDSDERMPPKGERLSELQVSLLQRWIDQGARWPDDGPPAARHWAYIKPVRYPLPQVQARGWPRNGIDYFVLARLEKEKLQPAPEADRATWLRRAALDLTGLPPALEDVESFLNDQSSDAYEKAADRLLGSLDYGVRWARPWLDLARYADTQGYEKDNRRSMWPYRDWVVNALNRDLPFDQFTIEQLAGDLLPGATQEQRVATGFHRNTMTNTEGGTDDEEFRHEAIIDRINTTMSVWMGTTMNCCQCHNHKYDPLLMKEYYQIYAFLNSTADSDKDDERPTLKVFGPGQEAKLGELKAAAQAAETKFNVAKAKPETIKARGEWEQGILIGLTNWQVLDPTEFSSAGGAALTKTKSKSLLAGGVNPSNDTYLVKMQVGPGRVTGVRLEVLEAGPDKALGRHSNGGFVLRKIEVATVPKTGPPQTVALAKATADFSQDGFSITNVLAGTGEGWAIAAFEAKNRIRRSAYFALAQPLDLKESTPLTFTLWDPLESTCRHASLSIL